MRSTMSNEFLPDEVIDGRYRIISRIGKGGMGLVYRVNHILINKEFALKTIDKNRISEMTIRRFQQEARTSFSLDHPNIIAVKDFGILEDQTPFLVMELVKGETLSDRLKRTGCLTLEQAIPIFVQICFGLAYAHECGIVHRDIKPSNIMLLSGLPLGTEGSIKIFDFGIAKLTEHEGGEIQALTRTGEIFGSPTYMSPEQCSGFRVDHRSDIYSLGCVFFEVLTGAPPYIGDTALITMMKHQTEKASTLKQASLGASFPPAMENIIATMLAKSPDNRYQNLGTLAHDLGAVRRGAAISQKTACPKSRGNDPVISMRRSTLIAIAASVVVAAGFFGYLFHPQSGSHPAIALLLESVIKPCPASSQVADETDNQNLAEVALKRRLAFPAANGQLALANSKITENSFELISNASWIHALTLSNCDINNESLTRLAKLDLHRLQFTNSSFNNIGAKKISQCRWHSLVEVDANGTNLTDEGVGYLSTIKTLKRLSLAGIKITDKSLAALAQSTKLTDLSLRNVQQITDTGLSAFEHSHLQKLDLQDTQIGNTSLLTVAMIPNLAQVRLNKTSTLR